MRPYIDIVETMLSDDFDPDDPELSDPHPSDERHKPTFVKTPTVLYRSVSPREAVAIWSGGRFQGGGNKFNEFDNRPWVFFADQMSDMLVWQGEDIERHAIHKLAPIFRPSFEKLNATIEQLHAKIVTPEFNRQYARQGRMRERRQKLRQEFDELRQRYRRAVGDEMRRLKNEEYHTFSSVIFQTKPLTGARYFEKTFKGGEYGFPAGKVGLTDVEKVYLVKDRKIIREMSVGEFDQFMSEHTGK